MDRPLTVDDTKEFIRQADINASRDRVMRSQGEILDSVTDPDFDRSDDVMEAHKTGITRIDERIDRLEAMVKRIAAHLGIEE